MVLGCEVEREPGREGERDGGIVLNGCGARESGRREGKREGGEEVESVWCKVVRE